MISAFSPFLAFWGSFRQIFDKKTNPARAAARPMIQIQMVVIEAASLEAAKAFAAGDPYVTRGVFARYEVHPFTQVYPK